ncbi:MAG: PAS domain-containing protein, partial [Xanthobacteraceae bacterium]|nr:PAS domain-containing protein [Xanthobacteraceae bacterium]
MTIAVCVPSATAALLWPVDFALADVDPLALGLAYLDGFKTLDPHEMAALALFIGVLFFAVVCAVLLVRTHDGVNAERARSAAAVSALAGEIDKLYDLLLSERQVVVRWHHATPPEIIGDPSLIAANLATDEVLTFAAWLRPEQALHLESHVDRLLGRGESFTISLTTASGRYVTAEGRAIGGSAVLKLQDVSGVKRDLADLAHRHQELRAETDALRAVVEALPAPVWIRDRAGRIVFTNSSYARALEPADPASALVAGREFFDVTTGELDCSHAEGMAPTRRVAVTVAGARRT